MFFLHYLIELMFLELEVYHSKVIFSPFSSNVRFEEFAPCPHGQWDKHIIPNLSAFNLWNCKLCPGKKLNLRSVGWKWREQITENFLMAPTSHVSS